MFTKEQEQAVEGWKSEWAFNKAFAAGIEEGEGIDIDALATKIRGDLDKEIDFPLLGKISAGDILQIDPRYDAGGPPQLWVVIEEWESGIWLLAPFSDFRNPAVRGDLLTPEGVVEVWNGRTVPKQVLKYGQVIGRSSEPVENLKALFRFCLFGYCHLPGGVPERTGTDIVDEDDPRLEYQSYETDRYAPLQYMVNKWFDSEDSGETVLPTSASDEVEEEERERLNREEDAKVMEVLEADGFFNNLGEEVPDKAEVARLVEELTNTSLKRWQVGLLASKAPRLR